MEQRDQDYSRHLGKTSSDVVVFLILRDSVCAKCNAEMPDGSLLTLRDGQALCMACAGLGDLVLLPSGDTALTRRASKLSSRRAVVVRWARVRKRYERKGTLVEASAIEAARLQCAADADETRSQERQGSREA